MSVNQPESEPTTGISDDQLPPDLVPGEDNPLAEGLPDGEGSEVLQGGKLADEMEDTEGESGEDGASS
jgi:hypothetical protein